MWRNGISVPSGQYSSTLAVHPRQYTAGKVPSHIPPNQFQTPSPLPTLPYLLPPALAPAQRSPVPSKSNSAEPSLRSMVTASLMGVPSSIWSSACTVPTSGRPWGGEGEEEGGVWDGVGGRVWGTDGRWCDRSHTISIIMRKELVERVNTLRTPALQRDALQHV